MDAGRGPTMPSDGQVLLILSGPAADKDSPAAVRTDLAANLNCGLDRVAVFAAVPLALVAAAQRLAVGVYIRKYTSNVLLARMSFHPSSPLPDLPHPLHVHSECYSEVHHHAGLVFC